jgi:nucleotide-binding universal stress UspA family protein
MARGGRRSRGLTGEEEAVPGIVVGIDGSPTAERALQWAVEHAAALHTSLSVIAVHQVAKSYWGHERVVGSGDVSVLGQLQQAAEEMTQQAVNQLGAAKPASVQVRAVNGFVVEELLNASRDAEELVLGSRMTRSLSRLVMGSVSNEIVQHASCPIVIVPIHAVSPSHQ